jgi:glycosyltransferase involved in cell wall biosynthesis
MGLLFYPRGGSAQVVRYLAQALPAVGWEVSVACGSLGSAGDETHAATFFSELAVTAADFTPAVAASVRGDDALSVRVPLHPSFEDRPGAPDRLCAAVSPELAEHQVHAWESVLAGAGFGNADVLHLHHLTPLHDAVAVHWPDRPVVTHLHGTELKMLDGVLRRAELAGALGTDLAGMAAREEAEELPPAAQLAPDERELLDRTRWSQWRFGDHWLARLRAAAARSDRFIFISEHDRDEAFRLLDVSPEITQVIPNGVDTERFDRRSLGVEDRLSLLRRWLVDEPQGWDESGRPGSIRYSPAALEAFVDSRSGEPLPVILFVGRFLGFKRVPQLVRAYARARPRFSVPAPLLVWGGSPGEWEGEHPHTVAERDGVEGVFFSGWRGHDELPSGLACADLFVGPSVDEPFGQVFLEAMSSGVPVVATRSGGPVSFVNTVPESPNGWLVPPDDIDALAEALVDAVNDETGRRERAVNGYRQIRANYAWTSLAHRFADIYDYLLREQ